MEKKLAQLLCIADTHFGDSAQYLYRGYSPDLQFKKVREKFKALEADSDLVLHLGDVCGDAQRHAEKSHYAYARSELLQFSKPALYVSGNHDRSAEILKCLPEKSVLVRDAASDRADYLYTAGTWRVLTIDSSEYARRAGSLSEVQFRWIDEVLGDSKLPTIVAIHHPPLPIGCGWIDDTMLLAQGEKFHMLMLKHRATIAGVLFGHIHDAVTLNHEGIQYSAIPSTIFSFGTAKNSPDGAIEASQPTGYAVVEMFSKTLRVSYRLL